MKISQAHSGDFAPLPRLLWLDTIHEESRPQALDAFADQLRHWRADRQDTHLARDPTALPGLEAAGLDEGVVEVQG